MECPLVEICKKIIASKKKQKNIEKRFFKELKKIGNEYDRKISEANNFIVFMGLQYEIESLINIFEILILKTIVINPENDDDMNYLYSEFRQIWALMGDNEKKIIKRLVNVI